MTIDQLGQMPARRTERWEFRGGALEVMKARDEEVLIAGPAGTGKSVGAIAKVHLMCLANPGMKALFLRQTLTSLVATGVQTYKDVVAAGALETGLVKFFGGNKHEPPQFTYNNGVNGGQGSRIMLGGMDQPTKVMSSEYDVIYAQESTELSITAWEKCGTRLRHGRVSFQQLIGDCNPEHPTHFLKLRCDAGLTRMIYSRHQDNPAYFDRQGMPTARGAAYLARLENLTGVRRLRLLGGIWAAADGVIYEGWDDAVHLVERFEPPESWDRLWAVDFGFVHPFVWQEWVIDPDGRMFLYREIYMTHRLVEDHAKQIKELTKGQRRPRAIVCDHDAEDRATLEKHLGMGTVAATKNVSRGIQAFASRLKLDGTGRPRLAIMKDACVERDQDLAGRNKPTCTAEEIPGYIWLDGRLKEQPRKEDDDGCDAARYAVADRDLHGVTRVRWG